jgi:hypothetical protein
MKKIYSLILIVFYAVIIFSVKTNAQGGKAEKVKVVDETVMAQKAFKIIPASLESEIPGIVESTIYNAVVAKKYFPSGDYSRIINKLNEIGENNPDPSIRYKAHLASIYLNFNGIIDVKVKHNVFDHEYIFRQIADQLESQLLVSK